MANQSGDSVIRAIITDIEGTTTAASFVSGSLLPYIRQNMRPYLQQNETRVDVSQILKEVRLLIDSPHSTLERLVETLMGWMEKDLKITPLKALQGVMWEDGYRAGSYRGHIYHDAYLQLKRWRSSGMDLYVYSSGSIKAQQLLFGNSTFGDLSHLISGYFDTTVGNKKEPGSYSKILQQLGLPADSVLFLSDSLAELDAATHAGMRTILVCREAVVTQYCPHTVVKDFNEIVL